MISLFICFPYKYFGLMKEETFPQCEPDEELFGMYGKTFLYRKSTGGFGLRIELPSIWCLFPQLVLCKQIISGKANIQVCGTIQKYEIFNEKKSPQSSAYFWEGFLFKSSCPCDSFGLIMAGIPSTRWRCVAWYVNSAFVPVL